MKKSLKLILLLCLFILNNFVWAAEPVSATRAAWIPNTEKLLVINPQQRPFIWDIVDECPLYFNEQHGDEVIQVIVSKNARLAATATRDKTIKIWDVATGTEKHEIIGFDLVISAMKFKDNPRELVLADRSGEVRQWNLDTYTEQAHFKAFDSAVTSMDLLNNKKLVALGSDKGEILVWDMQIGKKLTKIQKHKQTISAIRFSRDGDYIFSAGDDGQLLVWNYSENKFRSIKLHKDGESIHSLDVSPDGQYILAASDKGILYLIDAHKAELLYQEKLSKKGLQMATFQDNFEALVVDNDYHIWSFEIEERAFRAVSEITKHAMIPQSLIGQRGRDWTEEKTGIPLVWVDGGCFNIGCNTQAGNACSSDNSPARNICVDGFWIGQEEVTAPQWLRVTGRAIPVSEIKMNAIETYAKEENHGVPVASGVSWEAAQGFICRLNKLTQGDFRMPTEAEWEYACVNSTEAQQLRQEEMAASDKEVDEVQEQPLTGMVSIRGMHGSVSEWALDIYHRNAYQQYKHHNPLFLNDTLYYFYNQQVQRVKRGGGWEVGNGKQRCIVRQYNSDQRGLDPKTGLRLTTH